MNLRYITDTTPAILISILIFAWPKENIFKGKPYAHLIGWKELEKNFPWEVILLGGGSLAMADGFFVCFCFEIIHVFDLIDLTKYVALIFFTNRNQVFQKLWVTL